MVYVNDTVILFRHETQTNQTSPARLIYASDSDLPDVLAFHVQPYTGLFARMYHLGSFKNVFRREDIRDSWSKGDRACLAYLNEVCVYRLWVRRGPQTVFLQFPFLRLRLGTNDSYVLYAETTPEARGKNVSPHVLSQLSKDLEEKGQRLYLAAQEKNMPAIRSATKAGFRQIKKVRLFGLLGIAQLLDEHESSLVVFPVHVNQSILIPT